MPLVRIRRRPSRGRGDFAAAFRYERRHDQDQGRREGEEEPEDRGHGDGLDEQAGQQESDGGAGSRPRPRAARSPRALDPGAGDRGPGPPRASPSPRPRLGAPCRRSDPVERVGERADERTDRERTERDERGATFPVHIAQSARGIGAAVTSASEEAREQPCGASKRGSDALDRGEERDDHELLESKVEHADGQHPGDGALTPRGRHDACHGRCDGDGPGSDRPTGASATLMPSRRAGARALVGSLGRSTAARLAQFG